MYIYIYIYISYPEYRFFMGVTFFPGIRFKYSKPRQQGINLIGCVRTCVTGIPTRKKRIKIFPVTLSGIFIPVRKEERRIKTDEFKPFSSKCWFIWLTGLTQEEGDAHVSVCLRFSFRTHVSTQRFLSGSSPTGRVLLSGLNKFVSQQSYLFQPLVYIYIYIYIYKYIYIYIYIYLYIIYIYIYIHFMLPTLPKNV